MIKKIIDLSHSIDSNMSIFPGTKKPKIVPTHTMDADGCRVMELAFNTHIGTHLDAPAHMIPQGKTLSRFPLENFSGPGYIVDCSACKGTIFVENLNIYEKEINICDFVLLYTGYDRLWGSEKYLNDFPILSIKAAEWLISCQLKGIGVDAISIDPIDSKEHPIHKILLENEIIIIENLKNLGSLLNHQFLFQSLPLPIPDLDGSPTRAVAFLD